MDHGLPLSGIDGVAGAAPFTPGWLTAAGVALLLLLGIYAGVLLHADRLPRWLRVPAPASLQPRITIALVLVATLPAISLAIVLSDRISRQEYAIALGWLMATLIISVCLAVALAASIAGPLHTMDTAVRSFAPESEHDLPAAPQDAPREVAVVFKHLAVSAERQRSVHQQLQRSLRQGERLRGELLRVLESRETEIQQQTEELRRVNTELERLSRTDALTGVANQRGLAEFLERAWRAALRDQAPVSLLMIDIDHFEAYNDSYGRQRGDTCLQAVANTISHVVGRATDMVARCGAREFVIVLGNTPLEGALRVGEQLRGAIEGLAIPHRAAPGLAVVTVSVGVTSALPTRGSRYDSCLDAADRALCAAREQGRNRVGYSSVARTGLFQALCLPNGPGGRLS